jgi:hypothetical protein
MREKRERGEMERKGDKWVERGERGGVSAQVLRQTLLPSQDLSKVH